MTRNLPTVSETRSLTTVSPLLQHYLREIAKHPLLTADEEFELARRFYEDGDRDAAELLVTSNLRLVVKIANDFRRAQLNILDLIQEGTIGLMQAVKKFNPYKGVKLSSYAAWWIKAYILKYIMDNKSLVKIGTTAAQRRLFYNLKKEADRLLLEYDRLDTKLLAEKLDVKEKDVIDMQMRLSSADVSLDASFEQSDAGNDSTPRGVMIADQRESVEDLLASEQIRRLFGQHLKEFEKTLKSRDLEIFNDRLMSEQPLTLQQIGDKYGITRERARQLENRIIENLKVFVQKKGQIEI